MANPHADLYHQLRTNLWARHFALGRYWRANYFAEMNYLGQWPKSYSSTTKCGSLFERPSAFTGAGELRDKAELKFERWRVMRHDRSNPLQWAGLNLIELCVEHRLGYRGQDYGAGRFSGSPAQMVNIVLDTLASLFKFADTDNPFAGYILRWDPATCDNWSVEIDGKGKDVPQTCCEFLVNADNKTFDLHHFLYCTPFDDPRYISLPDKGPLRRWEPSIDEYVGLIMGYMIVFHTFENDTSSDGQNIVAKVIRQVKLVARYLQHVGYLLVRPNIGFPANGFTGNGAAGVIPCMEYPFSASFNALQANLLPCRQAPLSPTP